MPIVSVSRDKLFAALGEEFTDDTFQDLCFEYGIELDDVTSEKEMVRKEHNLQTDEDLDASEEIIYKIDIPANRYDMLCLEGISRALNIFRNKCPTAKYSTSAPETGALQRMTVHKEVALVRPFVVCAILRDVKFDKDRYNSFIDLQDKLHQNLCRNRTLVAIGTHDLDQIQGPFSYEALLPEDIQFIPLKQNRMFNAKELLQYYAENDRKLGKYVGIIQDSLVYPVIYDANRTVLSLPPIINGSKSAISLDTKNVFIECTATDLTKAKTVLNTVCCMFSEYCSTPFQVEPVEVIDALDSCHLYPDLTNRSMEVSLEYINGSIGVDLSVHEVIQYLQRMTLEVKELDDGVLGVSIPPTRSDILHPCDVMEDVAIAFGFNNIQETVPSFMTRGKELPLNQLTELVRLECAMAEFVEILTWSLCSHGENFEKLQKIDTGEIAVCIGNPATAEFEVCRTSLLSGALKTLGSCGNIPKPIKLFEISDVVLLTDEMPVGAKNERRLVAVHCNKDSGFEIIHGFLNRIMEVLGVPVIPERNQGGLGYSWEAQDHPTFFPGRHAVVKLNEEIVGEFGIVHPKVLENFGVDYPVSALEINLHPFCFDQFFKPLPTRLM
eukprot:g565.t1